MKLVFTGAQSTGKTTLLDFLKHDDDFRYNYEFIDEVTRRMLKKGVKINEEGGDTTQILIMTEHVKNLLLDNFIADRSMLDGVVYTNYLYNRNQISKEVMDFAKFLFYKYKDNYDYYFYLIPEFEIEDDGIRSANVEFRDEIVSLFEKYIKNIDPSKVIRLTGTVEERIKKFKETVNEYTKENN